MNILLEALRPMPEYRGLLEMLDARQAAAVSGVSQICRSHLIAALMRESGRPALIVCQDDMAAQRIQAELAAFLGESAPVLPSRELTFYDAAGVSREWEQKRLRLLYGLASGTVRTLIASVDALCLRTMPREVLYGACVTLRTGAEYDLDELTARLTRAGYSRTSLVEGAGQFALRGGILDVYSPAFDQPVRAEFFGDELDAMGFFDPITQRRTENTDEAVLLPVAETIAALHPDGIEGLCGELEALIARQKRRKTPNEALMQTLAADVERLRNGAAFAAADRYLSLIYPQKVTAANYISKDAAVFFCDHGNLVRAAKARTEDLGLSLDSFLESGKLAGELCDFMDSPEELAECFTQSGVIYFDSFLSARFPESLPPKRIFSITAKQLPGYGGNLETAVQDLKHYAKNDFGCLVLCGGQRRGEILKGMLAEQGVDALLAFPAKTLPQAGQILLTDGSLPAGLEYPELKLAVLTEGQLMARQPAKKARPKKATNRRKLDSFTDLTPGDLVVHEHHGIGRYVGMEQMKVDGAVKDYVKIAYQGTDFLYVPATQLDLVSKYIGGSGEDAPVRLNKLGGDQWQKAKAKAKAAAKDLAKGLIQLYAARKRLPGFAFAADSPWQQEFEESFEYAETDDQLRCIDEIKHDMEQPAPMDRLLCGDVGFGKTEVALRAVFKCVLDGKQCAVLVPTTILAWQHYQTFLRRLEGYPITVELLSRFRTPKQQKAILQKLADGKIDVVVGTHRLVQDDVRFRDLGLCVIDEEQRFGVKQKEKFKQMKGSVDVLTLSATPIPRTLNMAMSGIRDMSVINEAPQDRHPVQTYVLEYDDGILLEAIRKELRRGGQVFYLHNRIDNIELTAARLREALPEAKIVAAHGQMSEDELSDIWQRLLEREIDILVCTTIIEAGVDVPNCNTLIIEDADRMGLSQLYQLRGRVGRSGRRAYAYFTFRRGKALSEISEKRLEAIREFTSFGSGFRIAMRDLEIRGAGNILGSAQHGQMEAVGYDLYLRLLGDAIREQKGEKPVENLECLVDIQIEAHIPERYIPSLAQRIDIYKKIAAIRSEEDWSDTMDELCDRFGEPPRSVEGLLDVALIRSRAAALGVREIDQRVGSLLFYSGRIDREQLVALTRALPGRVLMNAGAKPYLTVKLQKGQSPLDGIREVLAVLENAAGNGAPQQKESSAGLPPETDCSIPVCGI